MRSASTIIIVLLVVVAIFYFTKPSDIVCRNEAMKIVSADVVKVPGYSDPNPNSTPNLPEADKILITNRFLWKDISYVYPASVKKMGRGYLGSFHPAKATDE